MSSTNNIFEMPSDNEIKQILQHYYNNEYQSSLADHIVSNDYYDITPSKGAVAAFVSGYQQPLYPGYIDHAEMGYTAVAKYFAPYAVAGYEKLRNDFNNPNFVPDITVQEVDNHLTDIFTPHNNYNYSGTVLGAVYYNDNYGIAEELEAKATNYLQTAYKNIPQTDSVVKVEQALNDLRKVSPVPDGSYPGNYSVPKDPEALKLVDNFINQSSYQFVGGEARISTDSDLATLANEYADRSLNDSPLLKPGSQDLDYTDKIESPIANPESQLGKYAKRLLSNHSQTFTDDLVFDIDPPSTEAAVESFKRGYNSNGPFSHTGNGLLQVAKDEAIVPLIQRVSDIPLNNYLDPHVGQDVRNTMRPENIHLTQEPFDSKGNEYADASAIKASSVLPEDLTDVSLANNTQVLANKLSSLPQTDNVKQAESYITGSNVDYAPNLSDGEFAGQLIIPTNSKGLDMVDDYIQGVSPQAIADNINSPRIEVQSKLRDQVKHDTPDNKGVDNYFENKVSDVTPDGNINNPVGKKVVNKLSNGTSLPQLRQMLAPTYDAYLKLSARSLVSQADTGSGLAKDAGTVDGNETQLNNLQQGNKKLDTYRVAEHLKALKNLGQAINDPSVESAIQSDITNETNTLNALKSDGNIYNVNQSNLNKWIDSEQDLESAQQTQKSLDSQTKQELNNKNIANNTQAEQTSSDISDELRKLKADLQNTSNVGANMGHQNYQNIYNDLKADQDSLSKELGVQVKNIQNDPNSDDDAKQGISNFVQKQQPADFQINSILSQEQQLYNNDKSLPTGANSLAQIKRDLQTDKDNTNKVDDIINQNHQQINDDIADLYDSNNVNQAAINQANKIRNDYYNAFGEQQSMVEKQQDLEDRYNSIQNDLNDIKNVQQPADGKVKQLLQEVSESTNADLNTPLGDKSAIKQGEKDLSKDNKIYNNVNNIIDNNLGNLKDDIQDLNNNKDSADTAVAKQIVNDWNKVPQEERAGTNQIHEITNRIRKLILPTFDMQNSQIPERDRINSIIGQAQKGVNDTTGANSPDAYKEGLEYLSADKANLPLVKENSDDIKNLNNDINAFKNAGDGLDANVLSNIKTDLNNAPNQLQQLISQQEKNNGKLKIESQMEGSVQQQQSFVAAIENNVKNERSNYNNDLKAPKDFHDDSIAFLHAALDDPSTINGQINTDLSQLSGKIKVSSGQEHTNLTNLSNQLHSLSKSVTDNDLSSKELALSEPSLDDKILRDDLQIDAYNHPEVSGAINSYFEEGVKNPNYKAVTQTLEQAVQTGDISFQQMGENVAHYYKSTPSEVSIDINQTIDRDSQESLELAAKITPDFRDEYKGTLRGNPQLDGNLAQGNLSRSGLENEVHLEQTVGRDLPLSGQPHQVEATPDAFNVSSMNDVDQKIVSNYQHKLYNQANKAIIRNHSHTVSGNDFYENHHHDADF